MKSTRAQFVFLTLFLSAVLFLSPSDCRSSESPISLGNIESIYFKDGPCAVGTTAVTGFKIFHPTTMTGNHPVLTWGNGTGAPVTIYNGVLSHFASWGFVVVASQSVMTITGKQLSAGIDYLVEQNSLPGSKFYHMLDTGNIGSTGHSQGGGGAINAAVADRRIKCCAPLAPAPGVTQRLHVPMFIVAGANDHIATVNWITNSCWKRAAGPTIFAIASMTAHGSFIFSGGMTRGYVTAWFMHHLQNDSVARQAFEGGGELFNNPNWKVVKKNY